MNAMNRQEWEFDYTASSLASAAEAQREFRKGRVVVWEGKKAEVMTKIKDTGLTIHEGIGAGMNTASNNYNAHGGAMVMVDSTLQTDLNECVSKIHAHKSAATDYDGWVQVLNANPEARLKLKHGDWMFFFGK